MKADISIMQIGIQVFSVFLLLLNLLLYRFLRKHYRFFQKKIVRKLYILLILIFAIPLLGLFNSGFHFIETVSEIVLSVLIYPALIWHIAHVLLFIDFLIFLPVIVFYYFLKSLLFIINSKNKIILTQHKLSKDEEKYNLSTAYKDSNYSNTTLKKNHLKFTRKKFIQSSFLAFPSLALLTSTFAVFSATRKVQVKNIKIINKRFSGALNKLRIVHISDLHIGSFIRIKELFSIVKKINSLEADIVVFTGDFCDSSNLLASALKILNNINAPLGIYACMGNHDYFLGYEIFKKSLKNLNIKMLIDETVTLQFNNKKFILAGLDYNFERDVFGIPVSKAEDHVEKMLSLTAEDLPTICLVHNPNSWDAIRKKNIVLTLSGHTHGGQFIFGKMKDEYLSPVSKKFPRFYDLYKETDSKKRDTYLYVTSGAGHWLPLRINCPREIALITLQEA